jgi:arylsulfatase A-like enzyme
VPFLLRYPHRFGRKGRRIPAPLNAPDIMPTLLGLSGLATPDSVEGRDWSSLILGRAQPHTDDAAFLNLAVPITEARRYGFAEYRGLRTAQHTYVRSIHGPWLLYDNRADPFQMHNLCGKDKQQQARLDRVLDATLRQRKDEFLPAAEYVKRANVGHYREVNVPVGRHPSPWGDWDSTLLTK